MSVRIADYREVIGEENVSVIERLAHRLRGRTLLMVNSTKEGGGVAEMLRTLTPLFECLGVKTRWEVVTGDQEFFETTKAMHNALQGMPVTFTKSALDHYIEVNQENAKSIDLEADYVIIHDPQPASLILFRKSEKSSKWVWRCHIDVSKPDRQIWKFLREFISHYDASIFSTAAFAQALPHPQFLIPPAIDPLSEKNIVLSWRRVSEITTRLGIENELPLIVQVSRFDRFKDPIGVIEAFRIVKRFTPCRLVLAGSPATDDPEGPAVLEKVLEYAQGDPDVYILNLPPDSNVEINAIQRAATVCVQKSIKEGFGLTVAESLWKSKPVVAGAVGGILLQVFDHHTGFLVHSPEGCAFRVRYLLQRPLLAKRLGETGHKYVGNNFLITRDLRDKLGLLLSLSNLEADTIVL